MQLPQKIKSSDDFQTPKEAINSLCKYIPKDWIIWECACGKGNLVEAFKNKGFKVIASDLYDNPYNGGVDFLIKKPTEPYDVIITNPPYSIKQQFLERAYILDKPFAFLLPLTTFETKKRQELFKTYGLEVIFLDKRINFQTPSGQGSGSWFATAWFTNKLNLGQSFIFESL